MSTHMHTHTPLIGSVSLENPDLIQPSRPSPPSSPLSSSPPSPPSPSQSLWQLPLLSPVCTSPCMNCFLLRPHDLPCPAPQEAGVIILPLTEEKMQFKEVRWGPRGEPRPPHSSIMPSLPEPPSGGTQRSTTQQAPLQEECWGLGLRWWVGSHVPGPAQNTFFSGRGRVNKAPASLRAAQSLCLHQALPLA